MASSSLGSTLARQPPLGACGFSNIDKRKYVESFFFPYCDDVVKYEVMVKIGHGTFGEVFKARDKKTNRHVALKKVLITNEVGFPTTALREIRLLKSLQHRNIINLIEICRSKATVSNDHMSTTFLVFDFCEHDLAGLLSNVNVKFSVGEIKEVLRQLFTALAFVHSKRILHRDLKTANILITKEGVLKLADFGLARSIRSAHDDGMKNRYTNCVVTLWYRPPELLLGDRNYGTSVDMWGAGCIMAEMWTRSPIFQGKTEQQQLQCISQLCGSLTPEVWPDIVQLEIYKKIELSKDQKRKVHDRLGPYIKDVKACDLLEKLLTTDPAKRITASNALQHIFFESEPKAVGLAKMLSEHSRSMFEYLTKSSRGLMGHYNDQSHTHVSMNRQIKNCSFMDRVW